MTTAFDIQFHAASPVSAKIEIFFKVYMNILANFNKVRCVFPMVGVALLPQADFGPNDYQEDAPYFKNRYC